MDKTHKFGFICIAGLPNAGKSSLINALVGEKVAIVSWRPQTTRNRILGVTGGEGWQMAFIDTPGIHGARNKLGEYMMKSVEGALRDVDAVMYVVDSARGLRDEDRAFFEANAGRHPIVVAVNKLDAVTQPTLFAVLSEINSLPGVTAVVPVSAKRGDNLDTLKDELEGLLPEGAPMFPEDMYTDSTLRFMAAEIVREKALYLLDKEVPYGIGVYIQKFEFRQDGICDILADIVCEKQSHKAIVIGKGGATLKKIGEAARRDLEKLVDAKVYLELYVRVKAEWRDSEYLMRELGYDPKDIKD